ncbi:DUF6461 domain-containing protein [Nonomuraea sp. NPDC050310]|uniref:DUF6461 domain-containing protein n=1 Tax=Nonomuraea sp. NPDC050310 TaxID=3154935 RepID=UPI0033EE8A0E
MMKPPTHFYEMLEGINPSLTDHLNVVWVKGRDIEEVAGALGADPGSSATVTLANPYEDVEQDPSWRETSNVVLIGEPEEGDWTICMQVQGFYLALPETLQALSNNQGTAFLLKLNSVDLPVFSLAENGAVSIRASVYEAPARLPRLAGDLALPHPRDEDWGVFDETPEMVSAGFIMAARLTGEEVTESWLQLHHERFVFSHEDSSDF